MGLAWASCVLTLASSAVALAAEQSAPAAEAKPEPAQVADEMDAAPGGPVAPPSLAEPTAEAPEQPASEPATWPRDESEDEGGREHADENFGHAMQFGLRAGAVGGYRMVFRYDKSPFCRAPDRAEKPADRDQQKFCGHAAPFALDVALSFGIFDFAEPYAWARFGLGGEAETNTEALRAFGLGARIYTMSDSKFKIFVEPAVGMELEGGAGNDAWVFVDSNNERPEYKTDFLFRLAVGPQYDFARAFGVYLHAGITTGVLRYIHTQLEVGIGAQLRVP